MSYTDYYTQMDDDRLIRFAINDSHELREDAYMAFYSVISTRGLISKVQEMGYVLQKPLSENELEMIVQQKMNSLCPICEEVNGINAIKVDYITSFLIFSKVSTETHIGCYDCLKNEIYGSCGHNLLTGFWSWLGIFLTPMSLISNLLNIRILKKNKPTSIFREIVKESYLEENKYEK